MRGRILLVDDDPEALVVLEHLLRKQGYEPRSVEESEAALGCLARESFDAVLTDYEMPAGTGTELCTQVSQLYPEVPTLLLTGHNQLEVAVEALRAGAFDFLTKPVEEALVTAALDRAVQTSQLRREVQRFREETASPAASTDLIGESAAMKEVLFLLDQAARVDISVLVTGETGTGKEVVARALHRLSPRQEGPFLAVNCAALPEQLLESELFGHVRGAFTDAREDKKGIFLQADGGTLFLDEIGDMPLNLQAKLLRALQDRVVRPVGSEKERPFDVRLVAATNQDLETAIEEGRFRRDLLFRLNVLEIPLPPLRERGNDVLLLAQYFLREVVTRLGKEVLGLSPECAARLLNHEWSGNVRELQNVIERAVVVARQENLQVADLPEGIQRSAPRADAHPETPEQLGTLAQVEARHIGKVLAAAQGNKLRAARILGIDRTTLYRKLERYGIQNRAD